MVVIRGVSVGTRGRSDQLPRSAHIGFAGAEVPQRDAQHVIAPKARAGDEHPASGVDPVLKRSVHRVKAFPPYLTLAVGMADVAKYHQSQGSWRNKLETRLDLDPLCKQPSQPDMLPDHRPQSLDAIAADHEPELEGTEPPAQLNAPVAIVDHPVVVGGAEDLGAGPEGAEQRGTVLHEVGGAIEVDQQPLVGIEDHAVRVVHSVEDPA